MWGDRPTYCTRTSRECTQAVPHSAANDVSICDAMSPCPLRDRRAGRARRGSAQSGRPLAAHQIRVDARTWRGFSGRNAAHDSGSPTTKARVRCATERGVRARSLHGSTATALRDSGRGVTEQPTREALD